LLMLIAGFVTMTWSSLSDQAHEPGGRLPQFERQLNDRLPPVLRDAIGIKGGGASELQSVAMPYALRFVRALGGAVIVFALAFILMIYLLIEGRRTAAWLVAFVPKSERGKVERTMSESKEIIFGYVAG